MYERKNGDWKSIGSGWKGRIGKNGLAWGVGENPIPRGAAMKREGDFKAPAGIFQLGDVWGYAKREPVHRNQTYHQITSKDLWVEDSKSYQYNQHVRLSYEPKTTWEKKQQMRLNDPPHSLKLFIRHNSMPHTRGQAGSAIFFHIWRRNGAAATAGCTTMPEKKLRQLVKWVDPKKQPLFILLPKSEYAAKKAAWKLP